MAGRSMRQRPRMNYAESDNPQQMIQAQQQMMANQALQASRQAAPTGNQGSPAHYSQQYYNGRLIEKQFAHPAHNKLIFNGSQNQPSNSQPTQPAGLTPKPPKQPQKPLSPHVRYGQKIWDRIQAERPKAKIWEITKETDKMWRSLTPEEKQPYIDEYEAAKIEYNESMQAYHNSPAYQAYTQYLARSRAQIDQEASTDGRFHGADLDELYSIEAAKDNPGHPVAQALETLDDELNLQELASKRFKRNDELMNEIFDERMVNRGWGVDECLTKTEIQQKFDKENVSSKYLTAGCIMAGMVTLTQIDRLKTKRQQLQDIIKNQRKRVEEMEVAHEQKLVKYRKRTAELSESWKKICDETPEETYKTWKQGHDLKVGEMKKQQEAKLKAKQEKEHGENNSQDEEENITTTDNKEKLGDKFNGVMGNESEMAEMTDTVVEKVTEKNIEKNTEKNTQNDGVSGDKTNVSITETDQTKFDAKTDDKKTDKIADKSEETPENTGAEKTMVETEALAKSAENTTTLDAAETSCKKEDQQV